MIHDAKPGEYWVIRDPEDANKSRCVLITQLEVGRHLVGLFTRRACHLYHEVRMFSPELLRDRASDADVANFWDDVY